MPIERLELHDEYLRVHFSDAAIRHADFHWFWLRHNSDLDRHPTTGERIVDSSELALRLRPGTVRIGASGSLEIDWADRTDRTFSQYAVGWLLEHAYAPDRVAAPPPPSEVRAVTLAVRDPKGPVAAAAWDVLAQHGLVVLRGFGEDTESLIAGFAAVGLGVIETHFGRIEDLRTDNTTNRNTDQLGYTDSAIQLHTDQPFLERPPRYQALHSMRPADRGGDNFLVDALAAAQHLADIDSPAYTLLCTVPVTFHRKQKSFEKTLTSPLLDFAAEGGFQIRYSYFTLAPHRRPFKEMEAWYRAYNRFAHLVRAERHQYRLRLEAGDVLVYDNWRMLHARTAFEGPRWVRGVYFDRAEAAVASSSSTGAAQPQVG